SLGAGQRPSCTGAVHAVLYNVSACTLDDPGRDRQSILQSVETARTLTSDKYGTLFVILDSILSKIEVFGKLGKCWSRAASRILSSIRTTAVISERRRSAAFAQ
ncbi:MAG: hypothetical protein AAFN74_20760, partial [Myxococcota bacterium]